MGEVRQTWTQDSFISPDDFHDIQCLGNSHLKRSRRPSQKPQFSFPHKTMVDIIDAPKQPMFEMKERMFNLSWQDLVVKFP